MSHLNEQQLTDLYYGEADVVARGHLDRCVSCRCEFDRLKSLLDTVREASVPERSSHYEAEVWHRLALKLPPSKPRRSWFQWWTLVPAAAVLLLMVFFAGMLTEQRGGLPGISPKARDRVLLITMGDHLDRSQILLAELAHSGPVQEERELARRLLSENRLLRVAAARNGSAAHAALLDDLERVLLDIANGPSGVPKEEVQDMLFKIRIISSNVRNQVQKS